MQLSVALSHPAFLSIPNNTTSNLTKDSLHPSLSAMHSVPLISFFVLLSVPHGHCNLIVKAGLMVSILFHNSWMKIMNWPHIDAKIKRMMTEHSGLSTMPSPAMWGKGHRASPLNSAVTPSSYSSSVHLLPAVSRVAPGGYTAHFISPLPFLPLLENSYNRSFVGPFTRVNKDTKKEQLGEKLSMSPKVFAF